MLADSLISVYNNQRFFVSVNTHAGSNPSPRHYTPVRQRKTRDSKRFQTFRDALTICFICNLNLCKAAIALLNEMSGSVR
jgi:hypothetical protein